MSGSMLKSPLLLLSVVISLCDGQVCEGVFSGDLTLTASQCTEPNELFNSTVSVLPGTNVILTCSLEDSVVRWNSSQFAMTVLVSPGTMTVVEQGVTFNPGPSNPSCTSATATINNIQDSMDELDLKCFTTFGMAFNSTVLFDVIDPPPPVAFSARQSFSDIVISWNNSYDGPCPITNYNITIDGITVSVPGNEAQYSRPISESECGSTLQINMSATNAAGTGNTITMNLFTDSTTVPEKDFPMIGIQVVTKEITTDEANITLMIDSSPFMVNNSDLKLSPTSGGGVCVIDVQNTGLLGLNCTGLSEGTSYDLTIDPSVGANCHMLLIGFKTDFTPTSPPPGTSSPGTTTQPSVLPTSTGGLDLPVIIGLVVAVVVVLLVIIAVVLMIGIYWFKRKGNKDEGDGPVALVEKTNPKTGEVSTYDDPAEIQTKEIPHKDAPTGDTYAVVDKASTRRAAPSTPPQFEPMTYQDPETIQRKEAPTGDVYAVVNKDKPVYSEVNKPQDSRVYADLALPKSAEGGVSRQPAGQEEKPVYSQIQHPKPSSPTGQDSSVDVPPEESLYEPYK